MTPKPSSARDRIFEDDVPLIITGRKARTRTVGTATLIASGRVAAGTVIRHLRFDEDGNLTARHVRIRRVAR